METGSMQTRRRQALRRYLLNGREQDFLKNTAFAALRNEIEQDRTDRNMEFRIVEGDLK
jgi:hypothetical protein